MRRGDGTMINPGDLRCCFGYFPRLDGVRVMYYVRGREVEEDPWARESLGHLWEQHSSDIPWNDAGAPGQDSTEEQGMSKQEAGAARTVREEMAGIRRLADASATGCATHPDLANPFCQTCRDHGSVLPWQVEEERWRAARAWAEVWAQDEAADAASTTAAATRPRPTTSSD